MAINTSVRVSADLTQFAASMKQLVSGFTGTFDAINVSAKQIGASIASAISVGALAAFTKEAIELTDRMGKLAQQAAQTTEQFSAVAYAAEFNDLTAQDTATAFKFLAQKMVDATRGGKEAVKVFQDLGVAFQFSDGSMREPAEVFRDIAEAMKRMTDEGKKTEVVNLAVETFGRSGAQLVPLLNEGAEGLERWRQKAEQAGHVVSEETAQAADEFGDTLQQLQKDLSGIFMVVAKELLPVLNQLAASFVNGAEKSGVFAGAAGTLVTAFKAVYNAVSIAWTSLKTFSEYLGGELYSVWIIASKGVEFFTGYLQTLQSVLRDYSTATNQILSGDFSGAFETVGDSIVNNASKLADSAVGSVKGAGEEIKAVWEGIGKDVSEMWDDTLGGLFDPFAGSEKVSKSASKSALDKGNPILKFYNDLPKEATKAIEEIDKEWAKATLNQIQYLEWEKAERLADLREKIKDEEDYQTAKLGLDQIYAIKRRKIEEDNARAAFEVRLAEMRGRRESITDNPDMTQAERKKLLIPMIQQESDLVSQQLQVYRDRLQTGQLSDDQQIDAQRRINELTSQQVQLTRQLKDLQSDTFSGTFARGFRQMFDEFSNVGRNLANGALRGIRTAVDGISNSILGMIDGTANWGKMFLDVGRSVLLMLIQIAVQAALVKVLTSFLPGFSSFIGLVPTRASGGPVTQGLYSLGEAGPEYVVDSNTYKRYGPGFFEGLKAGQVNAPSGTTGGGGGRVGIALVDDRSKLDQWIESGQFDRVVVQAVNRRRHEIAI